jgi:hypothetical protein
MRRFTRPFVAIAAVTAAAVMTLTLTACAPSGPAVLATFPATTTAPDRPLTAAVDATRTAIAAALGDRQLILNDTQTPIRPAEAPLLASAPRAVYQAYLPQDPDRGMILVYEFPDSATAAGAAAEQERYLASGPGRVQSPQGTIHVIRSLDTTVILYDWLPGAALDPKAPDIQAALETLGIGYPVD